MDVGADWLSTKDFMGSGDVGVCKENGALLDQI